MIHSGAHHQPGQQESDFTVSRALTWVALGGVVAGAAIIAAPHILPLVGIGDVEIAQDSMSMLHNGSDGLAGIINDHVLKNIPVIGERLAQGGLFNAAVTGTLGIGGVMLGRAIQQTEDGAKFSFGKLVQYAALASSALVALPTVLTALSAGLVYLSTVIQGGADASSTIGAIGDTVGSIGDYQNELLGLSGISATLPHFMTCGASVIPAAVSVGLASRENKMRAASFAAREALPAAGFAQRVTQMPPCCEGRTV